MSAATLDLTSEATDLVTLLDDAVPPPTCRARSAKGAPRCGAPATWLGILSCGHDAYLCDAHRDAVAAAVAKGAPCHAKPHAALVPTARFVPVP